MVTSEERIKVLKMIEEGKISVEDGAALLASLEASTSRRQATHRQPSLPRDPRMLRVLISKGRGGTVKGNVTLPLGLINAALNIASNYIDEDTGEQAAALLEAIHSGQTGKVLDYWSEEGGEHVQVFIE